MSEITLIEAFLKGLLGRKDLEVQEVRIYCKHPGDAIHITPRGIEVYSDSQESEGY